MKLHIPEGQGMGSDIPALRKDYRCSLLSMSPLLSQARTHTHVKSTALRGGRDLARLRALLVVRAKAATKPTNSRSS